MSFGRRDGSRSLPVIRYALNMSDSEYDRGRYDSVFESVSKTIASWQPRRYVLPDISKLLALPQGQAVMKVRSLRKLHTAEAARALRLASEDRRTSSPSVALRLAELAVYSARPAAAEGWQVPGGAIERDELAECLATLGNSYRIVGNTRESRRHLQEAARIALQGSGDPLVQAKIDWTMAVLLTDCSELDKALDLFTRSYDRYQQLDESWLANQVLASMARLHLRAGRSSVALRCALDCFKETRADGDPVLKQSLLNLVALAQLDLGEAKEARRVAQVIQRCSRRPENRAARVRGEWIEARALLAMGRWREGVEGLDRAREDLQEVGALGAAALAHLELALAHVDACHWEEASEIARQAFGALAAAGLEGQALIALRTVARAAEDRELSSRTLRRAIAKVNTGR